MPASRNNADQNRGGISEDDAPSSQKPPITQTVNPQTTHRPKWEIDSLLEGLLGQNVRVAGRALSPPRVGAEKWPRLVPLRDLVLPDNSRPAGLPVYVEGKLLEFERQIGVVCVRLDASNAPEVAPDGAVLFRGETAVILRAPAVVELAFPFQVERLPSDPHNYWLDFRVPRAQFEFDFPTDAEESSARQSDAVIFEMAEAIECSSSPFSAASTPGALQFERSAAQPVPAETPTYATIEPASGALRFRLGVIPELATEFTAAAHSFRSRLNDAMIEQGAAFRKFNRLPLWVLCPGGLGGEWRTFSDPQTMESVTISSNMAGEDDALDAIFKWAGKAVAISEALMLLVQRMSEAMPADGTG